MKKIWLLTIMIGVLSALASCSDDITDSLDKCEVNQELVDGVCVPISLDVDCAVTPDHEDCTQEVDCTATPDHEDCEQELTCTSPEVLIDDECVIPVTEPVLFDYAEYLNLTEEEMNVFEELGAGDHIVFYDGETTIIHNQEFYIYENSLLVHSTDVIADHVMFPNIEFLAYDKEENIIMFIYENRVHEYDVDTHNKDFSDRFDIGSYDITIIDKDTFMYLHTLYDRTGKKIEFSEDVYVKTVFSKGEYKYVTVPNVDGKCSLLFYKDLNDISPVSVDISTEYRCGKQLYEDQGIVLFGLFDGNINDVEMYASYDAYGNVHTFDVDDVLPDGINVRYGSLSSSYNGTRGLYFEYEQEDVLHYVINSIDLSRTKVYDTIFYSRIRYFDSEITVEFNQFSKKVTLLDIDNQTLLEYDVLVSSNNSITVYRVEDYIVINEFDYSVQTSVVYDLSTNTIIYGGVGLARIYDENTIYIFDWNNDAVSFYDQDNDSLGDSISSNYTFLESLVLIEEGDTLKVYDVELNLLNEFLIIDNRYCSYVDRYLVMLDDHYYIIGD